MNQDCEDRFLGNYHGLIPQAWPCGPALVSSVIKQPRVPSWLLEKGPGTGSPQGVLQFAIALSQKQ